MMTYSGSHEAAEAQWGEAAQEQQPTAIDPQRHLHYVEVSDDGLVATFVARGDYTDVGAVQADYPCPRNSSISYFEVAVLEASPIRPSICVGLAPRSFLLNRPPGIEPRSIGYRAEDGRKHCRKAKPASAAEPVAWEAYGPPYGQGDVVGCGILNSSRGVFFTKNGTFVGHAGKGSAISELFPTISMRHTGDSVKLNFAGPFLFNLQLLLHRQLLEERQLIRQETLPPAALLSLVRSYLLHAGFHSTLRSLNKALKEREAKPGSSSSGQQGQKDEKENGEVSAGDSESDESGFATADSQTPDDEDDSRRSSKEDYEAVLISWPPVVPRRLAHSSAKRSGTCRVSNAINLLQFHYPLVLSSANACLVTKPSSQDDVCALAKAMVFSQEVVECLRAPRRDVEAAVQCMQTRIAGLMSTAPPHIRKALSDCLGILAYEKPEEGPLRRVFDLSRRSLTASAVNKCILRKHLHVTTWSPLELLVRHLVACRQVLRFLGGSRGPLPSSREYCHPLPLRKSVEALEAELL
ncbi:hypothetical protein Emag_005853 [Eimeria magna]